MKNRRRIAYRTSFLITLVLVMTIASSRIHAQFQAEVAGTCNGVSVSLPFTDVAGSIFFCTIAEAYVSVLTNGTDATHYSPSAVVTRDQMSAFITRTQDSALRRGSPRAALGQWATPSSFPASALTPLGNTANFVQSDGADLWVSSFNGDSVSRVRASDSKLLDTYTGLAGAYGVLVARGLIYVTGRISHSLYAINPRLTPGSPGAVATVTTQLGALPSGITTDGGYIWTANASGSVSKVNLADGSVQTFAHGMNLRGIIYDGANIWVTDVDSNTLLMLNTTGNLVLQTISMDGAPGYPTFDGTNIWVPNYSYDSVMVVRVKDASGDPLPQPPAANAPLVVATLTGNGLDRPYVAAFDGQRVLVTNNISDKGVSLWKAASLSPLGFCRSPAGTLPQGACSDGINFWFALQGSPNSLARF